MKAKNASTHTLIANQLNVYKRERTNNWQCAYKIDSKWERQSCNTRDLKEAKERAHEILLEAKVRKKNHLAPIRRYFKSVAEAAIKRMQFELDNGKGLKQYADYIKIINKYLIPILGRYHVDSIDYKKIELLEERRAKLMNKVPTRSTLLNHNAALNRVFEEAIYRGYMTESQRIKVKAVGEESKRRPEFSVDELRALKRNFNAWVENARSDSRELRMLLRDYVTVLLDTGARAGKEILNLRWVDVELTYQPEIKKRTTPIVEEGGEEDWEELNTHPTLHLHIAEAKTKSRIANATRDSIAAFKSIAERNYGKTLKELIESRNTDYIFTYKEIVTKRQANSNRKPKLKRPTSFSKLFDTYLKEHSLLIDPITNQKRVLYSLRHSYATMQILYDNVNPNVLARQMGTSLQMIDKFYSHVDSIKAAKQLRGEKVRALLNADVAINKEYKYKGNKK